MIVNFTGFGNLETISGDMAVQNNSNLTSFTGLGKMTGVGQNLTITGNTMLPRATSQAFANSITVGGKTTIN